MNSFLQLYYSTVVDQSHISCEESDAKLRTSFYDLNIEQGLGIHLQKMLVHMHRVMINNKLILLNR